LYNVEWGDCHTLGTTELNAVCQTVFREPSAYAVCDRNSSHPALDWSCYVVVYPTPTPTLPPTRLGEFAVEWYCNEKGLGVPLVNNDADWACTDPTSQQILFILDQDDFNTICQRTYRNSAAYAVQDQNKPPHAYNWSCYVNGVPPTPYVATVPRANAQLTRLGVFQVEWYCNERNLGVRIINNNTDWACTNPVNGQIAFVLTQQNFDEICRRTYRNDTAFAVRDQNRLEPAYNWSCYTYLEDAIQRL
jgi:hypothetical protein